MQVPKRRLCHLHWTASVILIGLVMSLCPLCPLADDTVEDVVDDTCPIGVSASLVNGTVQFRDLPSREREVDPSYDGGAVEQWFTLARDFVNTVKEENLPYGVIEDAIENANLPCDVGTYPEELCENVTVSSFNVGETFSDFLEWWLPILIVACVGVVVGVAFLIVGCIFWVCRCCGRCGGGYSQKQSHDCIMCCTALLLLLCTLGLLAGVVLTFYSNQQSFDSLESVRVSVNAATDNAVSFTEDLLNDGIAVFCRIADVASLSLQEIEELLTALTKVLGDITTEVKSFLYTLENTANALERSGDNLGNVIATRNTLSGLQCGLEKALEQVADQAGEVKKDCWSSVNDSICESIPDPGIFVTVANYTMFPSSSDIVNDINMTLDNVNFMQEAQNGKQNFTESVEGIEENIILHLNESGAAGELMRLNDTVFEEKDNVTNSTREILRTDQEMEDCSDFSSIIRGEDSGQVDLNAGFIQECIINQGFMELQNFDVYRYSFGVAVSSLSLVVVILVLLGLLFGVLGFRPKRHPSDRTCLSHCGGVFLLIAVGVAYLFGFLVLVLAAVGFFFGSNAQKVCQSLEGPEYEGFAKTVDNEELWRGSVLGTQLFNDPQKPLYISQLLRNCEDNIALYKAMNLSFLFDIHTDIINFTEVTESVHGEILDAVRSIQFYSDTFLSHEALEALVSFSEAVGRIDFDGYQKQIDAPTLGFSVEEVLQNLSSVRNATMNATLQGDIDQLIINTTNLENMVAEINTQLDSLQQSISELQSILIGSSELVIQANDIIADITGETLYNLVNETGGRTFKTIALLVDSFISQLAHELDNTLGRCRPLWGVYKELHISVCYDVVDGLNGFWWSLGFCALFFTPIIILAVITSTFYMRQENTTTTYFLDDPYADYLMEDSSKRSSAINDKEAFSLEDKV